MASAIDQNLRVAIRQIVDGKTPWPLFVYGPAGTGKTCAGLCLLDHAGGEYWGTADLCQSVIQAQQGTLYSTGSNGGEYLVHEQSLWERIGSARLIVLDEIGSRNVVSDHHYACVKRVIDLRSGRPLVCISNLIPQEIAKLYDDRIASRLCGGTVVNLSGVDRRLSL